PAPDPEAVPPVSSPAPPESSPALPVSSPAPPGPLTQAELRRRLVASRHAVSMKMAILDPGRQSCRRGPVGRSALVAGDVALAAARADMTLGAPCPSPPAKQVKPPPKGKRCQVNDETRTASGAATRPARTGGGRR